MKIYSYHALLVAGALGLLASVRGADDANTIKFSDPSKPGTVKINLGRGELRVQGADTNEVTVKSDAKAVTGKPRKDGLRVISSGSSFAMKESDNVVTLDAAQDFGRGGSSSFNLTVPRNTTVIVQNSWGGTINCAGIAGDIEINSMQGEIQLDDVAGGVVVSTMNGQIHASIRELHEGKPLSFTSMNGEVVLRVPETAKANVRLRTQNGSVLTDFDETALVTKSEAAPAMSRGKNAFIMKGPGGKALSIEIQDAIREATQLSANAVKEALEAVKEGFESSKLNADEAEHEVSQARKEMEQARREADRARRDAERTRRAASAGRSDSDIPPPAPTAPAAPASPAAAPMPPKMPVPTISGGKLVTGTLNGGGPEISVATMNGDVTLRKLGAK